MPPDSRVPLTPGQFRWLSQQYPKVKLSIQSSQHRCYTDEEYRHAGIDVVEDMTDCDILFGVKEVPVEQLIPGKTYFFFSHTIKEQPYNRQLLQAILQKHIRLVDYEVLTDSNGQRVIAFGRWAGIVGAHNGLMAYGQRTGRYHMPRVHTFLDYNALKKHYSILQLPPMRIGVTGSGRVAQGVLEVLDHLNIRQVPPEALTGSVFEEPVYAQFKIHHLYERKTDKGFDTQEFYTHPERYQSRFAPYTRCIDLLINAIYWDPNAPRYFSKADMRQPEFSIRTIADITCDIEGSVPATLRATTIAEPVMGYDPVHEKETAPYQPHSIDIMSVDNLPNELPRDASADFGDQLIENVWDELINQNGDMIARATIAENGQLTPAFAYLTNYVEGK